MIGTVVDWRGSSAREAREAGAACGIEADWTRFVDVWLDHTWRAMDAVYRGTLPWTRLDHLQRTALDAALSDLQIHGLTAEQKDYLARVGHRCAAWPAPSMA